MEEFLKLFKEALKERRIYFKTDVVNEYWNITKTSVYIDGEKIVEIDGDYNPLRGDISYI